MEESDTGEVGVPAEVGPGKAIEAWAEEKQTAAWLLAATKAAKKWGMGKVVTEAEFDAALAFTAGLKINPS